MSRRNFTRLFHKTFGKSASQFVVEARITGARRRVLVPRVNLETIAASLGFKSVEVFGKAFQRHVGVRPCTYRARPQPLTAGLRRARQAQPELAIERMRWMRESKETQWSRQKQRQGIQVYLAGFSLVASP